MAANKRVIVFVPNGRRQNVKVTPNTTILQVLEEVCKKHEFNVDDYDIKHYNKVLDPNVIFRFSGLANNAQLEMIPCAKARTTSKVTIGIQVENGERLMGDFDPTATIAEVLKSVCPNEDLKSAVVIYMHREIRGTEGFESTTLKLLGLNSGRAALRLIHRDPEQLKTQAHVSSCLIRKTVKSVDNSDPSTSTENYRSRSSVEQNFKKTIDPISLWKAEKSEQTEHKSEGKCRINNIEISHTPSFNEYRSIQSVDKDKEFSRDEISHESCNAMDAKDIHEAELPKIIPLGKRNALMYNQAGAQALPRDELPDNFYDLTVNDAKLLLRDAKRRREQLEEAPLQTEAQRKLDHEKQILNQLHKYQRTVIRIQFPDQFVLQGLFKPLESVENVKDFIRSYLIDPESEFTVYTAPPKCILNSDTLLVEANLVPSAIIRYSGTSALKPEIKEKLTSPKQADIEAINTFLAHRRD